MSFNIKKRIWGVEYEEVISDGYIFWLLTIKKPFFKDGKLRIGLNQKLLNEAIDRKVHEFIIKVGEKEVRMSVPTFKELELKEKQKEFEDKKSLFSGSPPMRIYYFRI